MASVAFVRNDLAKRFPARIAPFGRDEPSSSECDKYSLSRARRPRRESSRFSAMEGFHQSSQQGLEALTAQQEDTKALLRKLANFFGEDPNVAKPDMILGRVADLLDKLS